MSIPQRKSKPWHMSKVIPTSSQRKTHFHFVIARGQREIVTADLVEVFFYIKGFIDFLPKLSGRNFNRDVEQHQSSLLQLMTLIR